MLGLACKDNIITPSIHIIFGVPSSAWPSMQACLGCHLVLRLACYWTECSWTECSWTECSWTECSWTECSWTQSSCYWTVFSLTKSSCTEFSWTGSSLAKCSRTLFSWPKLSSTEFSLDRIFFGQNFLWSELSLYLIFLDMNFLDRIMAGHNFLSTVLSHTKLSWTEFSMDKIFLELIFWTESSRRNFLATVLASWPHPVTSRLCSQLQELQELPTSPQGFGPADRDQLLLT